MNRSASIVRINSLAANGIPFLLISNFACTENEVLPLGKINADHILFDINGIRNFQPPNDYPVDIRLKKNPVHQSVYQQAFEAVHREIEKGNTYLLNLTFPTPIETSASLLDIFHASRAKYKLCYHDQFVVFSPETFVKIENGQISSYPMKGTIDASLDQAESMLLGSPKEMAEHATIVDLIRNDMSIFASQVRVDQFRYVEKIMTNDKDLLQVSSKITGQLDTDYLSHLGDILFSLLPAGSISGAPKPRTLEIISRVESYDRGYYTGIVGYFDGKNFDSGVMIRFIEKQGDRLFYKSGGGIHMLSDSDSEYQEMIDKVYVPIH